MPQIRRVRASLPPGPAVRRRSPALTYAAHERPPPGTALTLGLQHAATALTLLAYVIAAGTLGGLTVPQMQEMVAATALAMAICTALQAWGGRTGPGILLVHIPSPVLLLLTAEVLSRYGPGGMVGATLISAATLFVMGWLLPYLRTLFPPAVAGVVVCMSGVSLGGSSISHAMGMNAAGQVDATSLFIAVVTLATIVALSVWGSRRLRLFGMLAGIGAGLLAAGLTGRLTGGEQIAQAAVFALPGLPTPVLAIDPGLALAIVLMGVMSPLGILGSVVVMQKMEDADWRRADVRTVTRALRASALGTFASAWLGAQATATSSANIALAHISRTTSRVIGLIAAGLLALVAVMPQVTFALTLMPPPIIGAIEIYVAAFLIVSGIELIAQRALDSRGIFVVGISLTVGLAVKLVPALAANAPPALAFIAGNGIIMASLLALGLNLLFRLGQARSASLVLAPDTPAITAIADFVTLQGTAWGARRDVITRAALAALEASEAIAGAYPPRQLVAVRGSFDEYNLDITLQHTGPALALPAAAAQADLRAMLDDLHDEALDAALAGASVALLRQLADRVQIKLEDGGASLRLHFDH